MTRRVFPTPPLAERWKLWSDEEFESLHGPWSQLPYRRWWEVQCERYTREMEINEQWWWRSGRIISQRQWLSVSRQYQLQTKKEPWYHNDNNMNPSSRGKDPSNTAPTPNKPLVPLQPSTRPFSLSIVSIQGIIGYLSSFFVQKGRKRNPFRPRSQFRPQSI